MALSSRFRKRQTHRGLDNRHRALCNNLTQSALRIFRGRLAVLPGTRLEAQTLPWWVELPTARRVVARSAARACTSSPEPSGK